jgi:hypothetical protein
MIRSLWRDGWPALLLFAVPFLLLAPFWSRQDVFAFPRSGLGTDFLVKQWPNGVFVKRSIWEVHEFPMWRTRSMLGVPFLGNASSLVFYPLYWPILVLPVARAIYLTFALHLGILAAGMYAMARRAFSFDRWAAVISALSFGLSYKVLSHIAGGHLDIISSLTWLPWAFVLIYEYFQRQCARWIALVGVVLALSFLSHPPTALLGGLAVSSYVLFLWGGAFLGRKWHGSHGEASPRERKPPYWNVLWQGSALALAPVLALLVAAVQAIPMLALLPLTSRASLSAAEASQYALPPSWLPMMFMPSGLQFPEWSIYVGVAVLALVPAAFLLKRPDATTWFLTGMALVSAILSLGNETPLFVLLYRLVPGVSFLRVPSRLWFLTLFSLALLAGKGFDIVCASHGARGLRIVWTATAAVYVIALVTLFPLASWRGEALVTTCVVVPVVAWCLVWSRYPVVHRRLGRTGALGWALLLALLLAAGGQVGILMKPMHVGSVLEPTPVVSWIESQEGLFRIYDLDWEISPSVGVHYQLETLGDAEPFHPAYLARMLNRAAGCPADTYSVNLPSCSREQQPQLDARLLGLLNVRYVVTSGRIDDPAFGLVVHLGGRRLYANAYALPRVFVAGRASVLESQDQVCRRTTAANARRRYASPKGRGDRLYHQCPEDLGKSGRAGHAGCKPDVGAWLAGYGQWGDGTGLPCGLCPSGCLPGCRRTHGGACLSPPELVLGAGGHGMRGGCGCVLHGVAPARQKDSCC